MSEPSTEQLCKLAAFAGKEVFRISYDPEEVNGPWVADGYGSCAWHPHEKWAQVAEVEAALTEEQGRAWVYALRHMLYAQNPGRPPCTYDDDERFFMVATAPPATRCAALLSVIDTTQEGGDHGEG